MKIQNKRVGQGQLIREREQYSWKDGLIVGNNKVRTEESLIRHNNAEKVFSEKNGRTQHPFKCGRHVLLQNIGNLIV